MTFTISKIALTLAQPSSVVLFCLVLGIVLASTRRFARGGLRLTWLGLAGLVIGGVSPAANLAVLPLEQRFPVPAIAPQSREFAAIVVLGGAELGDIGAARGQLTLNEAAERVTEGLRLAHLLPAARLVFTGGAVRVFGNEVAGAPHVAEFWRQAGIAPERIVLEVGSRNTWENALFTHRLLAPKPGERYLLVTTAHHMPRSIGAFRKVGFDVVAYPVDFRTAGVADGLKLLDGFPRGFRRLDDTTKEWAGLLAYRLAGRSSALFPAP